LRFNRGIPNINGAKKPDCNANSANAFPDGSRQLIGSIHSMGMVGIRMGVRPRRPPPGLRGFEFCTFIRLLP
jgi:hypothetical protein